MDGLLNIGGIVLGLLVLVSIAFPDLIIPGRSERTKKVGSTYWGVYEGRDTEEPESRKTIEVKAQPGKEKVVAGSQAYAMGRTTSIRG